MRRRERARDTPPGCESLPGAETIWPQPGLRFVLAGEIHGTNETPAIFRDLVCAATASNRPIVAGVEHGVSEQEALDMFMAPEGHVRATTALLAEEGWNLFDGRRAVQC